MAHFATALRQVGGGEEEVAGFFGGAFLPSDQDFVTPIEMDSTTAVASAL